MLVQVQSAFDIAATKGLVAVATSGSHVSLLTARSLTKKVQFSLVTWDNQLQDMSPNHEVFKSRALLYKGHYLSKTLQ